MHVAVLGGVVYWLCRLLRVGPRGAAWGGKGFALFYGLVSLLSPPGVRSVLLCAAFGLGIVSGRWTDPLQMLSVSVLAMLLWGPLDLFNPGFQLSFGTVLGLIILTGPMLAVLTTQ